VWFGRRRLVLGSMSCSGSTVRKIRESTLFLLLLFRLPKSVSCVLFSPSVSLSLCILSVQFLSSHLLSSLLHVCKYALFKASSAGHLPVVRFFVDQLGFEECEDGIALEAAVNGHLELLQWAYEKGGKVSIDPDEEPKPNDRISPLYVLIIFSMALSLPLLSCSRFFFSFSLPLSTSFDALPPIYLHCHFLLIFPLPLSLSLFTSLLSFLSHRSPVSYSSMAASETP
jgi:hypothetical protein